MSSRDATPLRQRHGTLVRQQTRKNIEAMRTDMTVIVDKKTAQAANERRVREMNVIMLVLAILALIAMIIVQETSWDFEKHNSIHTIWSIASQVVLSGITVVHLVMIFLYYRHQIIMKQKRTRWSGFHLRSFVILRDSGFLPKLLLELVVVLIHAPPFSGIDNKASLFVVFRLYVVVRVLRDWSPAYRLRQEIAAAAKDDPTIKASENVSSGSWIFGIKWFFNMNALYLIVTGWVSIVLLISFSIWVTERERNAYRIANNYNYTFTYFTSIYFVVVTATTLGYGDMVPLSDWGRGVSVFAALVGTVMSGFLVAAIGQKLAFDRREQYAALYLRWKSARHKEKISAAKLVKTFVSQGVKLIRRQRKQDRARAIGAEMRNRRAESIAGAPKKDPRARDEELRTMIAKTAVDHSATTDTSHVALDVRPRRGSMVTALSTPSTRLSVAPVRGSLAQSLLSHVQELRRRRRIRVVLELSLQELQGSAAQIDEILVNVVDSAKRLTEIEEEKANEIGSINKKLDMILANMENQQDV